MVRTKNAHEGSALLLCIILMLAVAAVYTQLQERYTLFMQTVYEREQYIKLRATAHALLVCALDTAAKNFAHYVAYKNYQEQLQIPMDHQQQAAATITYSQRDTPKGQGVSIDVTINHKQRTCTMHALVSAVVDPSTGDIQEYSITDWCIR